MAETAGMKCVQLLCTRASNAEELGLIPACLHMANEASDHARMEFQHHVLSSTEVCWLVPALYCTRLLHWPYSLRLQVSLMAADTHVLYAKHKRCGKV